MTIETSKESSHESLETLLLKRQDKVGNGDTTGLTPGFRNIVINSVEEGGLVAVRDGMPHRNTGILTLGKPMAMKVKTTTFGPASGTCSANPLFQRKGSPVYHVYAFNNSQLSHEDYLKIAAMKPEEWGNHFELYNKIQSVPLNDKGEFKFKDMNFHEEEVEIIRKQLSNSSDQRLRTISNLVVKAIPKITFRTPINLVLEDAIVAKQEVGHGENRKKVTMYNPASFKVVEENGKRYLNFSYNEEYFEHFKNVMSNDFKHSTAHEEFAALNGGEPEKPNANMQFRIELSDRQSADYDLDDPHSIMLYGHRSTKHSVDQSATALLKQAGLSEEEIPTINFDDNCPLSYKNNPTDAWQDYEVYGSASISGDMDLFLQGVNAEEAAAQSLESLDNDHKTTVLSHLDDMLDELEERLKNETDPESPDYGEQIAHIEKNIGRLHVHCRSHFTPDSAGIATKNEFSKILSMLYDIIKNPDLQALSESSGQDITTHFATLLQHGPETNNPGDPSDLNDKIYWCYKEKGSDNPPIEVVTHTEAEHVQFLLGQGPYEGKTDNLLRDEIVRVHKGWDMNLWAPVIERQLQEWDSRFVFDEQSKQPEAEQRAEHMSKLTEKIMDPKTTAAYQNHMAKQVKNQDLENTHSDQERKTPGKR